MKVASVSVAGERCVGHVVAHGMSIAPFDLALSDAPDGILALIRRNGRGLPLALSTIALSQISREALIPVPRRKVGKNYHEHAHEFTYSFDTSVANDAVPENPVAFSKVPASVISCRSAMIIDLVVSEAVDYGAELAVIIGESGRDIAAKDAFGQVWGYAIINDVTARDLQARCSQGLIGKAQDTFCPMGLFAVTGGEIDISNTPISCYVNGEPRQRSNTGLLIFDIPTIIDTLSAGITLQPSDVIATGTLTGVGIGFDPPQYLKGSDVVRIEIDSIGVLENEIVERSA
jgi:2-keto-4-pentenoate hydratase/2-oxohepta-3-ene-1,7-dioic acid hydratase in catechol pathway